jgi:hypothetical protein
MTRETKFNLIFLVAFLALSLPGAVMLVKKKMRPGATPAPLSRPDPVRRQLPYMAPQATSEKIARYVPPLTREWLCEIDRSRGGSGVFLTQERQPVMSDDRVLQVLNWEQTKLSLIVWADWKQAQVYADGVAGVVERFDTIEVPGHIRAELQAGGFVTPPKKILWLRARFEQPFAWAKSTQVQVKTGDVANPTAISVNLFTS